MQTNFNYKANYEDANEGFEPIPAGKYKVAIIESGLEENNEKTGDNLVLTYQIIEGALNGRQMREWLAVNHEKEKVVEIAHRKLNSICKCIGIREIQNTNQLHDKPLVIEIKYDSTSKYPNSVGVHEPVNSQASPVVTETPQGVAATGQQEGAAPNTGGNGEPPWARK